MQNRYHFLKSETGRTGALKKGSCSLLCLIIACLLMISTMILPVYAEELFEDEFPDYGESSEEELYENELPDYGETFEEDLLEENDLDETADEPAEEPEDEPVEEPAEEYPSEEEPEDAEGSYEEELPEPETTDVFEGYSEEFIEALFAPGDQDDWSGAVQSDEEFAAQVERFPESYHEGLWEIHSIYPNYRFTADYTGMDFQTLVDEEDYKKVSAYSSPSYKAMYDESFGSYQNYDWETGEWINSEGAFTLASREIIEYFIDPRNFLNTYEVYMFLRLSYSGEVSIDDVRSFLDGTFLADGYTPNPDDEDDVRLEGDYAKVLLEASELSGVSPFVLATIIFSEQSYRGGTDLISGYYEAEDETIYIGLYNFYNYGATGTDHDNVVQNGLERAKASGWTSRYRSIVDGAILYADGYISNDQDTYYYKNFNVLNGWNGLWHQYATAINNSRESGVIMREVYADSTYAALEFRIPVYDNMPEEPAGMPEGNDNLNNYYFTDMKATGLEPAFSMANRNYTMTVTEDTTLRIAVPEWAAYEGYDAYELYPGENLIQLDVRSQTGYLRSYKINVMSSGDFTLYVETYESSRLMIDDDRYGPGDVNGDGTISALDYIAIKNHIMEIKLITERSALDAADLNEDGRISALDYIAVKNDIMSR